MAVDESTAMDQQIAALMLQMSQESLEVPQRNISFVCGKLIEISHSVAVAFGIYSHQTRLPNIRHVVGLNALSATSLLESPVTFQQIFSIPGKNFILLNDSDFGPEIQTSAQTIDNKFRQIAIFSKPLKADERGFLCLFAQEFSVSDDELKKLMAVGLTVLIGLEYQLREQLLFNELDRYKSVFDHANDGILIINKENSIIQANTKAYELFGYNENELIGMRPQDLSPEIQEDGELSDTKARRVISEALLGKPLRFLWQHLKKDGSIFHLDISLGTSEHESGQLIHALLRDITGQKELENELKQAKKRAEEADQMKSAFLANMSHDIRTPLNSIIGFSEILLEEDTTEDEKLEYTQLIVSAGKSLQQLIDDIIDLSKIEAGQIRIVKTEVDINQLLDELFTTFTNLRQSSQKDNIELRLKKQIRDKSLLISTDPFRFRQIMSNLLSNALKFIDRGYIEFGYTLSESNLIQFYVKDTGVGIEREKAAVIFQRFGQIDSTYKRNHSGTGLGLSICKSLVELLGGSIWFDSEKDLGTTFYFTLPIDEAELPKQTGSANDGNTDWSDKVFLVVDDVQSNYLFLKAMFKETAAAVVWARTGKEAIDLVQKSSKIDLVLMDIRMPEMDGYEASRRLRNLYPELPIIAQTAFTEPEDFELAMQAGCDEYITKPICANELLAIVKRLVN